jgi:hypothetical protein
MDKKWFFYGCADNEFTVTYALYEHTSDCFFLVDTDEKSMKDLAFLFSSRYQLTICQLNTAHNYLPELIDNTVCVNWTLTNKQDIPIARFPRPHMIVSAEGLVEKSNNNLPWNYNNEQNYLMAAKHWLSHPALKGYPTALAHWGDFYHTSSMVPGAPFENRFVYTLSQIKKIIYQEFDLPTAHQKINQLLTTYEFDIH